MIKYFRKYILERKYWEISIEDVKEKLLNNYIMFYDLNEMHEVFNILSDLGFIIYPIDKIEEFEYNCFVPYKDTMFGNYYDFMISLKKPNYNSLNIDELKETIEPILDELREEKEKLRKKMIDIDPYGEEDWNK